MMKRIYLFTIAYFTSFHLLAQFQVSEGSQITTRPKALDKKNLELLKNAKTYFLYFDSDRDHLDEMKRELSGVWTFNTLEFLSADKVEDISNIKDVAAFYPWRSATTVTGPNGGGGTYYHAYLALSLNLGEELYTFARIELQESINSKNDNSGQLPFANWSIPLLKAYLYNINKALTNGTVRGFHGPVMKRQMKELHEGTLIIPEETVSDDRVKKLMSAYTGKFEVMPSGTIQAFVKSSDKPVFIASFLTTSNEKYSAIYDAKTGELVYNRYAAFTHKFKKKDIVKIERSVKRAIKYG
jgi:hypothetical protein